MTTCSGLALRGPAASAGRVLQQRRRGARLLAVLLAVLLSSQLAGLARAGCCINLAGQCFAEYTTSDACFDDTTPFEPGWVADKVCGSSGFCVDVPPTGASGDPHIKGFDGSDYLLWGKPNTTYNLISERSLQVNIHLYHPPGRADAHALYINAVGVLINGATIAVHLVAPAPTNGDAAADRQRGPAGTMAMYINGATQPVAWAGHAAAERAVDAHTTYTLKSSAEIVIASTDIRLSVVVKENDHLDLHVEEVAAHWRNVHGVMGQTHKKAFRIKYDYGKGHAVGDMPDNVRSGAKKQYSLQGTEDDYVTSGLLNTDDKFTRFVGAATAAAKATTRKLKLVWTDGQTAAAAGGRTRTGAAGVADDAFSGSTARVKTVAGCTQE